MERKLEEIDEILASYEDWMHGINGEQCTKARKLLSEVQQQLKILNIPVVSGSLPDSNTTKIIKEQYEWEGLIDLVECCKIGPITDENYCPKCGKKILRQ